MRYLKGTSNHGLVFGKSKQEVSEIRGYLDFNFARDLDKNRKKQKIKKRVQFLGTYSC